MQAFGFREQCRKYCNTTNLFFKINLLSDLFLVPGNTLKYWMASALPILVCSYFFLWFVPVSNGENQSLMVMYYLIIYILLQIAFTVYSVPYAALIMYQTNDQKERDIATAFRMTAEIFFAIMSIAVMGGIIRNEKRKI